MTFIKHDVRDDMTGVMSRYKIDWAIHAAFVISVIQDIRLLDDIDLKGTINFHKACEQLGIKNVMQVSSTTAYGGHKDNPALLTEDLPLRGNDDFPYGKNKAVLENTIVKEFREKHPEVNYTVVRPCFVCGPHFYKNPLGRHLMKKIGSQRLTVQLGYRYYAEAPDYGPDWGLRFAITFLFPKG
jgi:UDP-glucose 4-epimerase